MPELPEVEALAAYLRERAVTLRVANAWLTAISALKTFDHPLEAVVGARLADVTRHGKFLDIGVETEASTGLRLIVHLARAGWLHYREQLAPAPPKPGKGPLALRIRLEDGSGFDLTEAGTKKSLAVYLVTDPAQVPGVARLGPDALVISEPEFCARIAEHSAQIKRVLTDQTVIAGIGNAYSDEVLHAAKLSPFAIAARLTDDQRHQLFVAMQQILSSAVERSVGGRTAELKAEKRSGLRVHARAGLPCPVCQDTVAEVSFADRSLQYCPTCQTGHGKPLADRRMSRLLR